MDMHPRGTSRPHDDACSIPVAGTRCEEQLNVYQALNAQMQADTRATFAEFEASIGSDSERHLVIH